MRRRTVRITLLAVVVLAAVAACTAWQPAIDPVAPVARDSLDSTLVAQGARISALGDCMYCHTAEHGKPFAGGRPVDTPFGAIYSTNITPDLATGIGGWSREAFGRALRDGVSRDGHLLYPAFPYPHFTHMTQQDVSAVYAYLMARDPVNAPPTPNALRFPFGWRPMVAGWNLLFLSRGEVTADPAQSSDWNLGRYLVEGPGHCAACHTPMNVLGGEKAGLAFSGGQIDGWDVPALNALMHAPVPWTKDQLVAYLGTGLASEHGAAAGPMLPVTHALADAPASDLGAMATYLLSLQNAAAPAPPAPPTEAPRLGNGAALFASACASCHDASAPMAAIGSRPLLSRSSVVNAAGPRNTIQLILHGIPADGSRASHYMPPFATALSDAEIADIAAYVRATYSRQPAWPALENTVASIRKETSPQ
jgi:mono/diheme cytochrome c family protein